MASKSTPTLEELVTKVLNPHHTSSQTFTSHKMRKTSAILAVAACASVATSAAPQKRYVRDPNQTVSGNELAYNITAPASSGGQAWTDAHARVVALVDEMTLDEKVSRAWEVGKQLGGHSLLMCDGTTLCRSAL